MNVLGFSSDETAFPGVGISVYRPHEVVVNTVVSFSKPKYAHPRKVRINDLNVFLTHDCLFDVEFDVFFDRIDSLGVAFD